MQQARKALFAELEQVLAQTEEEVKRNLRQYQEETGLASIEQLITQDK